MKIAQVFLLFVLFTCFLAVLPVYLIKTGQTEMIIPNFWALFTIVSGLTGIVIMALVITQKINPSMYVHTFLACTTFKILAVLSFIVFFLIKTPVDKTAFVVNFIYIYFLNTAFEVYVLLRNLRNQNLK